MSFPKPGKIGKPTPEYNKTTSGGNHELAISEPRDKPDNDSPGLSTEEDIVDSNDANASASPLTQRDDGRRTPSSAATYTALSPTDEVFNANSELPIDTPSEYVQSYPLIEKKKNTRPARRSNPKYFDGFLHSQSLKTLNEVHSPHLNVDAMARILACIDQHSYEDAILRDSDRMLERYLIPMDFPWMHGVQPVVKSMAYDIDEMPGLLRIEDEVNSPFERGTFGYGKFETGKNPKGGSPVRNPDDSILEAARRSNDPGVIELTTIRSFQNPDSDSTNSYQYLHDRCLDDGSEASFPGVEKILSINGESGDHFMSSTSWRKEQMDSTITSDDADDPIGMLSDASLRVRQFRYVQAEKKRKLNFSQGRIEKKYISVRFGSASSRTTLFEPCPKPPWQKREANKEESQNNGQYYRRPILVNAFLPVEVVNGRYLNVASAKAIADQLGSYDARHGVTGSHKDEHCVKEDRKRVQTGRIRMIWTKEHSSDKRTRVVTSILTGNLLEPSNFRRSREVRVAVKLNGEFLSHEVWESSHILKTALEKDPSPPDTPVAQDAGLSDKIINAAIAEVAGTVAGRSRRLTRKATDRLVNKKICLLDTSGFVRRLIRSRTKPTNEIQYPVSVMHDDHTFRTPRFECLPAADGIMRIICTSFGTLASCWVPSVTQLSPSLCTICSSDDSDEKIDACRTCRVAAHVSCCWNRGEHSLSADGEADSWQCASCFDNEAEGQSTLPLPPAEFVTSNSSSTRRRSVKIPARFQKEVTSRLDDAPEEFLHIPPKRRQCIYCPHVGGAMSAEGHGWIHDVCRMWGRTKHKYTSKCVYCGEATSVGLTKCAGNGCSIHLHPMCAILVSKMIVKSAYPEKGVPSTDLLYRKHEDIYLSTQATLTMIHVTQGKVATLMPVAFCGYHNPVREPTFYGSYPAGQYIGESVRIPPNLQKE